jgi:hypothetical protein
VGISEGGTLKNEAKIVDTKINACKITTGFAAQFFMKGILEKMEKYSNFSFKCPFRKVIEKINELIIF